MPKFELKHKIDNAIKLIDLMMSKYNTLLSYFVTIKREKKKGKAPIELLTLPSTTIYTEIVDLANDIMFSDGQLHQIIKELMEDHIRLLTGKDIIKLVRKYKQLLFTGIRPFYNLIKYKSNQPAEQSFTLDLPGASAIDPKFIKQNVYDMYQKSQQVNKLMIDFEKLLEVKGSGVESSDIPRKYM